LPTDSGQASQQGKVVGYGLDVFPSNDEATELLLQRIEDLGTEALFSSR
jgi:hypothetical protein